MTQKEINELNNYRQRCATQKAIRNLAQSLLPFLKEETLSKVENIAKYGYELNNYRDFLHALLLDAAMRYSFGYSSLDEYKEIEKFHTRSDHKNWCDGEYEPWTKEGHNTFFPQYQLSFDKSLSADKNSPIMGAINITSFGKDKRNCFIVGKDSKGTIHELQFSKLL